MYLDKLRLDGRSALVTGGGQGIGLCCADALAEAGAAVTIADRDPALLERAHAVELPFASDTLACASGPKALLGERPPLGLADAIHTL